MAGIVAECRDGEGILRADDPTTRIDSSSATN